MQGGKGEMCGRCGGDVGDRAQLAAEPRRDRVELEADERRACAGWQARRSWPIARSGWAAAPRATLPLGYGPGQANPNPNPNPNPNANPNPNPNPNPSPNPHQAAVARDAQEALLRQEAEETELLPWAVPPG